MLTWPLKLEQSFALFSNTLAQYILKGLEQAIRKKCLFAFLCAELWFLETSMKTRGLEPKFKQFSSRSYFPAKQTTKNKEEGKCDNRDSGEREANMT